MMPASASIVIITRNRSGELRRALKSAVEQTVSCEIIVIDDGSTDETLDVVRALFPRVTLIAHVRSAGYIVRRNEAARLATGDVVFSIDDDAVFSTSRIVEQTLREFNVEGVGAVAIPFVNVNTKQGSGQRAPDRCGIYLTDSFVGTAHAVRRDVFVRLGGYREEFFHQGEECDFCVRMLNAGYVVRLGAADRIDHYESPRRDLRRMDFYGSRNSVLFAWHNVPLPFLLGHLPATTTRCILYTLRPSRLRVRLAGLLSGYRRCWSARRAPVSSEVYRLTMKLRKNRLCMLENIDRRTHQALVRARDRASGAAGSVGG